ncbi:MAG: HlyD family efflux transporter periplasmic adaptor subunit [Bryobacterales bacterium]|nr:HlyD family efflux transporter periplasmic adaptor subunit [Bryobacterales bacterium]
MSGGASDFMQVIQNLAKPGSLLKKGETVAEFDKQYQLTRLDDYKATVLQSEQSLRRMDAELEVSRKAHDQSIAQAQASVDKAKLDIQTIPVRSAIDAERMRLALEEAEASLKQLKSEVPFFDTSQKADRRNSEIGVEASRVELRRAQQNVDRLSVIAPIDGMLVMQNTMRGTEFAQIQQGDQLYPGQMFAQIVDPRSMLVVANANQVDAEMIHVGAEAHLRFDAYPGLKVPAKVISVAAITRPGGMRASFYKEIPVYLKIEQMDPRIIPDLSVSVDVIIESVPSQVIAPLESVFQDGPNAEPYVFVKSGSRFERRAVQLGLRNYIATTVPEGLKAGEVVALEPPHAAPAGSESGGPEERVQRS